MAEELLKFQLALIFYKAERHNFILDYDTKARLSALWKQATVGKASDSKEAPPGFFDYVGKHRLAAWEELGDMTAEEAAVKFVAMLQATVEAFQPWLDRRLEEKAEQDRKELERIEAEKREAERREAERIARLEKERIEQERARQLLLKQQQEQEEKARQLLLKQQQIEQERLRQQQQQEEQQKTQQQQQLQQAAATPAKSEANNDGLTLGPVAPHDLPFAEHATFIAAVQGRDDCTFPIGRGELVTVRVPNTETAPRKIVWQFATVDYDVAFGLDYERTGEKVEAVLPVIRCPSNEKVIVGSHTVQGAGNWLFNFDNTYSILRSKTLYLRVASESAQLKAPLKPLAK